MPGPVDTVLKIGVGGSYCSPEAVGQSHVGGEEDDVQRVSAMQRAACPDGRQSETGPGNSRGDISPPSVWLRFAFSGW